MKIACAALFIGSSVFLANAESVKIVINSEVLHLIDGTPFIDMVQLVHFALQIHILQNGPKNESQAHLTPKITWRGKQHCIKELAALEQQHPHENFEGILAEALEIFEKIAQPQLDHARGAEAYMMSLITQWSIQRNKPTTYLLNWGTPGSEHESLIKHMTSFSRLDEFCSDLKLFLTDMMHTCKKSWGQYMHLREEQKKKKNT